jgi:hypothetical protein
MERKLWQEDEPAHSGHKNVRECVECGTKSPETETNYTLISSRHGWRLTRSFDAEGRRVMQWRCPNCWNNFKIRK